MFFLENDHWVYGLIVWQWVQIMFMFAQERFGPAFLYVPVCP